MTFPTHRQLIVSESDCCFLAFCASRCHSPCRSAAFRCCQMSSLNPIVLDDDTLADAIRSGTISAEAHDLFLQAYALLNARRGKDELAQAQGLLAEAIQLDPQYFVAHTMLVSVRLNLANLPGGGSVKAAIEAAVDKLEEVERLDLGRSRPYREIHLTNLAWFRRDWPVRARKPRASGTQDSCVAGSP